MQHQVQRTLAEIIDDIGIRCMSKEDRSNLEITTPDGIVQGCVCLVLRAPHIGAGTSVKKQLHSLEAVATPDETGTSDSKLQGELTAPLQTGAARIGICVALEQQPHCSQVGLPYGLMQSMLPQAGMSALKRCTQKLH